MLNALDVLGLQPFIAADNVKGDFVAFIEGLEPRAHDGRMMHKDILPGILSDEAKPLFIIEPLDFATGHKLLLIFEASSKNEKDTAKQPCQKSLWETTHASVPAKNIEKWGIRQGK
jgi:hypothetical protein